MESTNSSDSINKLVSKAIVATNVEMDSIMHNIKSSVSDILSGSINVILDRVNIGDYIEYKNQIGKVQQSNLKTTTIITIDGHQIKIPNSQLTKNNILRCNLKQIHKPDLYFNLINYDQVEIAKKVILNILNNSFELGQSSDVTNTIFIKEDQKCNMVLYVISHSESKDTWEHLWSLKKEMHDALHLAGCIG